MLGIYLKQFCGKILISTPVVTSKGTGVKHINDGSKDIFGNCISPIRCNILQSNKLSFKRIATSARYVMGSSMGKKSGIDQFTYKYVHTVNINIKSYYDITAQ